jgi:phenylacetate-CoA ligase
MARSVSGSTSAAVARAAYGRMRAAHLNAVQAALEDHIGRLDWSGEQSTPSTGWSTRS